MNIRIDRPRVRDRENVDKSESWVSQIQDATIAVVEKGGNPDIALVTPTVFEKVKAEIKSHIEYGYSGPSFGKDYGMFINVHGWNIEIISEPYLNASVLVGEKRCP